jgi:hypothetical protein
MTDKHNSITWRNLYFLNEPWNPESWSYTDRSCIDEPWNPKVLLDTYTTVIPDEHVNNRYFKNKKEIARSGNGIRTYTPKFKELCHERVNNGFERNCYYILQSFVYYIPDALVSNGYADSRQVLVYFKNGEKIARSKSGVLTYTPKFKELCHEFINKMFDDVICNHECQGGCSGYFSKPLYLCKHGTIDAGGRNEH